MVVFIAKMTKKLNILFICNKSPWPASEGGPIAMNQLIEGLAVEANSIKVLAINTNKYSTKPRVFQFERCAALLWKYKYYLIFDF